MQHLVPVSPQLHDEDEEESEESGGKLCIRQPEFYLNIHVSSFEKRQSLKRIDSGTLSRKMLDEEYRMYFRQLRYATMLNPIDYISNPDEIEGEYNTQFYAMRSKFYSSRKRPGVVMIPNEMVDARTMTHNSVLHGGSSSGGEKVDTSNSSNNKVANISAEKS